VKRERGLLLTYCATREPLFVVLFSAMQIAGSSLRGGAVISTILYQYHEHVTL